MSFCPSYFRLCVRRCPCIEYWLSFDDASYVLSCHRAPSHIWQRKKGEYVICCLFFVRSHIEDYQHILKVCFWESWVFRTQRKLFLTFSLDVFLVRFDTWMSFLAQGPCFGYRLSITWNSFSFPSMCEIHSLPSLIEIHSLSSFCEILPAL